MIHVRKFRATYNLGPNQRRLYWSDWGIPVTRTVKALTDAQAEFVARQQVPTVQLKRKQSKIPASATFNTRMEEVTLQLVHLHEISCRKVF